MNQSSNRNKSQRNRVRRTSRAPSSARIPNNPPPNYAINQVVKQRFRFTAIQASTAPIVITRRCILNLRVSLARNTGVSQSPSTIYSSVRVRKISIWGISSGDMIGMSWLGTNAPDITATDIGTVMRTAKISRKAPRPSRASEWINTIDTDLDTQLMQLVVSNGATIDISVDTILQDALCLAYAGNFTFITPPTNGAIIYSPNLDNVTTANVAPTTQILKAFLANGSLDP